MFWSGNYIVVRELNSLLKEENVTLTQVLEADDVLQECKADNKALIQFLTRPDILAELITLITEEPPKNVELGLQYRHASIACEVLTSQLSTLSDRLSMDTVQMNRLCDFINREPPLNPLLASYFSKTIEMLLERSPKQDWYLYHIVCLRVLDFLKARRDFLPNLLRHLHTSAAVDALKCFVRLNDLFNKIIMEWLEEHQFLDSLIQIICGTYEPPPLAGAADAADAGQPAAEREEKGLLDAQGKEVAAKESPPAEARETARAAPGACEREGARGRLRAVAAANASTLLCDILLTGCAGDGCQARGRTAAALAAAALSGRGVGALLAAMFTAPPRARRHALVHGAAALLAMRRRSDSAEGEDSERSGVELCVAPHLPLLHTALLQEPGPDELRPTAAAVADSGEAEAEAAAFAEAEAAARCATVVEGAEEPPARAPPPAPRTPVGAARLMLAQLLAALAASSVHEVASTMLTLGTPAVLLDMFFAHPDNNFLHAHVVALVTNALANRAYRTQYARHILEECDLVNRLIDVYEENENKKGAGGARSGYMGHVLLLLRALAPLLDDAAHAPRWAAFAPRLAAAAQRHDTPLGGYYPSANSYETESMVEVESAGYSNYNDAATYETATYETANYDAEEDESDRNKFLKLANQRMIEQLGSSWEDGDEDGEGDGDEGEREGGADVDADDWNDAHLHFNKEAAPRAGAGALEAASPWDAASEEPAAGEGWAQFSASAFGAPADPFAEGAFADNAFAEDPFSGDAFAGRESFGGRREGPKDDAGDEFTPFWSYQEKDGESAASMSAEAGLRALRLGAGAARPLDALSASLADNLRTAMSSMTPEVIANIVNANMGAPLALHAAPADAGRDVSDPNASSDPSSSDAASVSSAADAASVSSVVAASVPSAVEATSVSSAGAASVPSAAEAASVSSTAEAASVPSAGAASVPNAADATSVPSAGNAVSVPSAADATSVSSAGAASVPSTTEAASVSSTANATSVPNAADATSVSSASNAASVLNEADATSVPRAAEASVPSAVDAASVLSAGAASVPRAAGAAESEAES